MRHGELLGVGNTASVYRWGNTEAIKIFHHQENSWYEATKEAKNAEIINNLNLKAPKYSGMLEYEGKSCLIYERIDGPTMLTQIEMTKSSITHFAKLMAQLHHEIHQVKVDLRSNLKDELCNTISAQELINEDEKRKIKGILDHLPEGNVVCHYDFHPGNIILSPKGPIIIDWLNTMVGNEAADIARSSMMLKSNALPPTAPELFHKRECRELLHEKYLKEYFMLAGMKQNDIEEWMAPTLAARIHEVSDSNRSEVLFKLRMILNN